MLTDTGASEVIGFEAIKIIVGNLLNMCSQVITFISGNPLMMIMFSGSLIGVACYVVSKVKKTSKV